MNAETLLGLAMIVAAGLLLPHLLRMWANRQRRQWELASCFWVMGRMLQEHTRSRYHTPQDDAMLAILFRYFR